MAAISRSLLLGIEERGRDATGAAWFGRGGGATVQKAPVTATRFVNKLTLGRQTSTAILHTRAATVGDPRLNENNHPVVAPGKRGTRVVGTHNGWVNNVASLLREHNLPRAATVDSEVIFSLLSKYGEDYTVLGRELSGNYACAWIREDRPGEVFLMRGYASPLVVLETEYGIFYASTEIALAMLKKYIGPPKLGYVHVSEGRALHLQDGAVGGVRSFSVNEDSYDWNWGSKYYPVRFVQNHEPVKTYVNVTANRRSWLGSLAEDLAKFVGLNKKGDYYWSEYGQYVMTGAQCVDFTPTNKSKDVEEVALEDLLYLSTLKKAPKSINEDIHSLMDKLYPISNGKELEKFEDVQAQGTTSDGTKFMVLGDLVYMRNEETGEYEDTGTTYEEYLRHGGEPLADDDEVQLMVESTMSELLN